MLIPGLPVAGVQQDAFKPERKIRPGATEGVPGDPLSELPVEEYVSQQQDQRQQQDRRQESAPQTIEEVPSSAAPGAGSPDLPRKGLLVDIRA